MKPDASVKGIKKMRKDYKWDGKNLSSKKARKEHNQARKARKNRHALV